MIYALIPVVAGVTTYLVSHLSSKMSGTANQGDNPAASSMKTMNVMFPLMTAWFAITLPAGLGLYWTVSNLFQIVQMYLLNRFMKVDVNLGEEKTPHYRERKKKKNSVVRLTLSRNRPTFSDHAGERHWRFCNE